MIERHRFDRDAGAAKEGFGLAHPFGTELAFDDHRRSEEHTSELQSLMRNSYAVFCLTKKKTQHAPNNPFNIKQIPAIEYANIDNITNLQNDYLKYYENT